METYQFTTEQLQSANHHHYPDWLQEAARRYVALKKDATSWERDYPTSALSSDFGRLIDHDCSVVIDGVECYATLPYNPVYPVARHMASALGIELFTPKDVMGYLNGTMAFVHLYRPWAPWDGSQARTEGWDLETCDKGFTKIVALPLPELENGEFIDATFFPYRRAAEKHVFDLANNGSAYHSEASARITPCYLDPRPEEEQLEEYREERKHQTNNHNG